MKVVLSKKIVSSAITSGVSFQTEVLHFDDASDIEETTDLDGDKCYSVTATVGGSSTTRAFKQKDYIISIMGGV